MLSGEASVWAIPTAMSEPLSEQLIRNRVRSFARLCQSHLSSFQVTAHSLVHFFNEDGLGAIINSSRGIIAAYKQDKYKEQGITPENFADASRMAVEDMIADIAGALASK